MASAETFWRWFEENGSRFESLKGNDDERPLLMELNERVCAFCPNLVWEIGNGPNDTFELVISADGIREFFPRVRELVDAAPAIDGWTFTAFKQPEGTGRVTFNGEAYSIDDFWFAFVGDNQRGLIVLHRDGEQSDLHTAAILLLDATIGEYDAVTGIDAFKLDQLPDNPEEYEIYPMRELYQRFHARS